MVRLPAPKDAAEFKRRGGRKAEQLLLSAAGETPRAILQFGDVAAFHMPYAIFMVFEN
jgi:hypothetical protein